MTPSRSQHGDSEWTGSRTGAECLPEGDETRGATNDAEGPNEPGKGGPQKSRKGGRRPSCRSDESRISLQCVLGMRVSAPAIPFFRR